MQSYGLQNTLNSRKIWDCDERRQCTGSPCVSPLLPLFQLRRGRFCGEKRSGRHRGEENIVTVEHLVGFLRRKKSRANSLEDETWRMFEFCDGSSPKLVLLNDECYVFNSSLVLRVLLLRLYLVEEVYFVIEIGLFFFFPFCFLIVSVLRLR